MRSAQIIITPLRIRRRIPKKCAPQKQPLQIELLSAGALINVTPLSIQSCGPIMCTPCTHYWRVYQWTSPTMGMSWEERDRVYGPISLENIISTLPKKRGGLIGPVETSPPVYTNPCPVLLCLRQQVSGNEGSFLDTQKEIFTLMQKKKTHQDTRNKQESQGMQKKAGQESNQCPGGCIPALPQRDRKLSGGPCRRLQMLAVPTRSPNAKP